jgi:hypothetical protein
VIVRATDAAREAVKPRKPPPKIEEAKRSLFQFLAGEGGLAPHGDLQGILDGNPFVPGFGRLVRKNGMSLDHAMEKAREAGYVWDQGQIDGTVSRVNQRDLLNLIDAESRGRKQYRAGYHPEPKLDPGEQRALREAHRQKLAETFDAAMAELQVPVTKTLRERALRLMERESDVSALDAYERVLLEHEQAKLEKRRAAERPLEDVPFGNDAGGPPPAGGGDPFGVPERPGNGRTGGDAGAPGAGQGAGHQGTLPGMDERRGRPVQGKLDLQGGEADAALREKLRQGLEAPLTGGSKPPPKGGLFDTNTQFDAFDYVPALREDGTTVMLAPDQIKTAGERPSLLADLVLSCK